MSDPENDPSITVFSQAIETAHYFLTFMKFICHLTFWSLCTTFSSMNFALFPFCSFFYEQIGIEVELKKFLNCSALQKPSKLDCVHPLHELNDYLQSSVVSDSDKRNKLIFMLLFSFNPYLMVTDGLCQDSEDFWDSVAQLRQTLVLTLSESSSNVLKVLSNQFEISLEDRKTVNRKVNEFLGPEGKNKCQSSVEISLSDNILQNFNHILKYSGDITPNQAFECQILLERVLKCEQRLMELLSDNRNLDNFHCSSVRVSFEI
ncbi:MAG: hypothetical protein MHPSP_001381 [Paramarteilia canceri]